MMKIYLLAVSFTLFACGSGAKITNTSVSNSKTEKEIDKQDLNTTAVKTRPNILIGKHYRRALEQEPFAIWFNQNYTDYTIDSSIVKQLSPYLEGVSIKAFMGTWCSDSKRETPAFYKILDDANFDYKNLELITVTRNKDTPEGYEKGLDISRVPTFIFYKKGKEIGRYVEFARETLEKDMLTILSEEPYKHSYED